MNMLFDKLIDKFEKILVVRLYRWEEDDLVGFVEDPVSGDKHLFRSIQQLYRLISNTSDGLQ